MQAGCLPCTEGHSLLCCPGHDPEEILEGKRRVPRRQGSIACLSRVMGPCGGQLGLRG